MPKSKPHDYILEYWQAICDDSEIVGKWVRLAYQYIIDGLEEKRFYFDRKKANKAIKFIETYLHHCKGRHDLIKLELWQKALISVIFGIVDADGVRVFREIFLVVGRKNGKSLLASAISACVAYIDGEYGGEIYYIGPKLDQASICFDNFAEMVKSAPDLDAISKKRRTDIYIPSTNTSIKKLAYNYKTSDGLNPSLTVCDEISAWSAEQGRKQYEVIASALGARKQPMILAITTAGNVNNGPYDDLFKRSTQLLLGNSKETQLFPAIYMIDEEDKWSDICELKKANPNMGVSVSANYFINEIAKAELTPSKKTEFLMKYCNIKQTSSSAFLSAKTINGAFQTVYDIGDFAHTYCVAGLDLSSTIDLTSLSVVIERDGILHDFTKFWIPAGRIEEACRRDGVPYDIWVQQGYIDLSGDKMVDYHDCVNYLLHLVHDLEILPLVIGYDRWNAPFVVQELEQNGFHCDSVQQFFNLSPVIREFEGLMLDGRINIANGSPIMKQHLADSALFVNKIDKKVRLVKIIDQGNIHIDGVMSLVDALTVRQKWYEQYKEQLKNN
jgi:phage terminase large subunit-like protein